MSTRRPRGRPKQERPDLEALPAVVRKHCRMKLRVLFGKVLGEEVSEERLTQDLNVILGQSLQEDLRRAHEISAFYVELSKLMGAYAHLVGLLGREPFENTARDLAIFGRELDQEGADYQRWALLIDAAPTLNRLLDDRRLRSTSLQLAPLPAKPSSKGEKRQGRERILRPFFDKKAKAPRVLGGIDRPLALSELAWISLAVGNWPKGSEGASVADVVHREAAILRKRCVALGWALPAMKSGSKRGEDLCAPNLNPSARINRFIRAGRFCSAPIFSTPIGVHAPFHHRRETRSMTPKEIRLASGLSVERAAVAAGVTSPTLRLYEANTEAPSAPTRAKLETFYATLAARLAGASASPTAAA